MEQLPLSRLVIKGSFTQSDGLQWISNCVPNVPNVVGDGNQSTLTYYFRSIFTRTVLIVEIEDATITV